MIADFLPIIFGLIAALSLGVAVFVPSLTNPFLAVLILVASLPFERVPSLDIGGVSLRFNQLAAMIVIVVTLLSLVFDRKKIQPVPLIVPLLALLLFVMWTIPGAANVERAVSVFVFVLLMAVTAVIIPQALSTKEQVKKLAVVFIAVSGLISLFGFFQFFGDMVGLPHTITLIGEGYGKEVFGFPRIQAFSKEPLYLANFLFLPIGVMLGLFLSRQDVVPRLWLTGILGSTLVIFLLTLSRGAFIAMVPLLLLCALFFLQKFLTWRNVTLSVLGLAIVGGLVWGILGLIGSEARERFLSHATLQDVLIIREGESGFGRLTTFERAIEIWQRSPITGVGLGNYGPAVAQDPLIVPEHGWDIVNNQYLESLAETGIIGLALLLLLWGWTIVRSFVSFFTTRDPLIRAILGGLTAALVAMLVQYNFFSTLYIMHIWVAVGLLIALQNIAFAKERA
jgi:hypothetical protein